jgi:hypothetical protein
VLLVTLGPFAGPSLSVERARIDVASAVAQTGPLYAEDSGVLIAAGVEPVVDDPYVWARLVALGELGDGVTPRVNERRFAAILSDVDLERIDQASHVEQQRWPGLLVSAVRERYRLERHEATLWVYVPR